MTATRIVKLSERFTRELLGISGGEVNRDTNTAANGIGFLASVDGIGTETSVLLDKMRVFVLLDKFLSFIG